MQHDFYECLYIIQPDMKEDQFKSVVAEANKHLEANGGKIEEVAEWGLQSLATPIGKKTTGYYVNVFFTAPGTAIEVFEREMKLNEDILRFLTLKYDAKMLRHRALVKKGEVPSIFEVKTEEEA